MPPISGMGRMLILQAIDALERLGKRLEVASRDTPIGYGPVVEIHFITPVVTYKLVTHNTPHLIMITGHCAPGLLIMLIFHPHFSMRDNSRIDVDVSPRKAQSHRASPP